MNKSENLRINISIVEIIKLIKDYSKTPLEEKINEYLSEKLDSLICREPIKNRKYLLEYLKPTNDFIIHTTQQPFCETRRILN